MFLFSLFENLYNMRHLFSQFILCVIIFVFYSCKEQLNEDISLSVWPKLELTAEQLDSPCNCLQKMEEYVDALLIIQEDFLRIKRLHQEETNPDLKAQIEEKIIEIETNSTPYKEQLSVIGMHCEYSNEEFESCGFFERVNNKLKGLN